MPEDPSTTEEENPKEAKRENSSSSFWMELKRRKVTRVAVTYAIVAWLVIQIAVATFPSLYIPQWALTLVIMCVLLGFPVALILAWAFELTPDGIKVTKAARSDSGADVAVAPQGKRKWAPIVFAALLPSLIFGTLAVFFYLKSGADSETSVAADRPYRIGSVAVLPFTLLSKDDSMQVTADGLQEEMLTTLSEFGAIDVASRSSTFQYREERPSMPEIGQVLGSDYIIEGSLQLAGTKLRATLQLIEASTDTHVWAETFDRDVAELDKPLRFQKEFSFELAIESYLQMESLRSPNPDSVGRMEEMIATLMAKVDDVGTQMEVSKDYRGLDTQIELLERILRLDPDNLDAYRTLLWKIGNKSYRKLVSFYDAAWNEDYYLHIRRAETIGSDDSGILTHLGNYYRSHSNQPVLAAAAYKRSIEKDRAEGLDIHPTRLKRLAHSYLLAGRYKRSLEVLEGMDTSDDEIVFYMGQARLALGRIEEHVLLLDQLILKAEKGDPSFLAYLRFTRARNLVRMYGSTKPIEELMNDAEATKYLRDHLKVVAHYFMGDFDALPGLLAETEGSTSRWGITEMGNVTMKAYAHFVAGNNALAESYCREVLQALQSSEEGLWMQEYRPDVHASSVANLYALLGDRENSIKWVNIARTHSNPSRRYADYCESVYSMAEGYATLGMVSESCSMLDQLFSSPSPYRLGFLLISPSFKAFHHEPDFRAVARKHVEQLKDPTVLDELFGE
ncbi:tetratricopeptide repeat protein [Pelagicoccus mobilis]|uniref:Adenylate cyclase n=1 Tax=Pelagicoccus mobilis TaxID=415221 RepID=A0A934RZT3_9BACT|nr:hypothetical protein [Pelagicoccus mobilis]MBK1880660.1 hypothetical protein [Pelagicoccus mobilis]